MWKISKIIIIKNITNKKKLSKIAENITNKQ